MATPCGIIGTTGVGGLTLGGGLGHLTRRCGLSVDNLLEADVVLADGTLVTASAEQHPELYWALRGGGGNFGVVTSFLFRLHPIDTVVAGPTFWALEQAGDVMRWYRDFILAAPETLNGFFAYLTVPPVDPSRRAARPEGVRRRLVLHGRAGGGRCRLQAGRRIRAAADARRPADAVPGAAGGLRRLVPARRPMVLAGRLRQPAERRGDRRAPALRPRDADPQSTMHLYPIDGAAHRPKASDTPFAYRDANWAEVIVGVSPDPKDAARITAWTKDYWNALHPHSAGGAYVNMMMDEGDERIRASYRDNYPRLVAAKRRYDPKNLFRVNQNIRPE